MKAFKAFGYGTVVVALLALNFWLRWYAAAGGIEKELREAARPASVVCEHWYVGWRGEQ